MQTGDDVGSAQWVGDRLRVLAANEGWSDTPACRELVAWLYPVALHRARTLGVSADDLLEVAQDAMPRIVHALRRAAERIASALNPAAVLERIVARAVSAATHRFHMAGLGGVPPNGRHWHTPYPTILRGRSAERLLAVTPDVAVESCHDVEHVGAGFATWVSDHLDVVLTDAARHAVVYVLDRMVAGVGRSALVRGGHAGLAADPAMRHLGFTAVSASAFARWLLGRVDPGHKAPAVLDAYLDHREQESEARDTWRRVAIRYGFAHVVADRTNSAAQATRSARRIA